ncbi:MAG: hypothetical protein WBG54_02290 [Acidobacteriaceae bacterium]
MLPRRAIESAYTKTDLDKFSSAGFSSAGLKRTGTAIAHLTKIAVCAKDEDTRGIRWRAL